MATPPPVPAYRTPGLVQMLTPPPRPALKAPPSPNAAKPAAVHVPKTFSVVDASDEGIGEKIVLYGSSGMGKTTLAAMAPDPVFIAMDPGSNKIRDPRTGKVLKKIGGVETFQDLRDALHSPSLFDGYKSAVLDTVTKAEEWSDQYILEHFKTEKGGTAKSLEHYGFNKGYRHALEVMRLLLQDAEGLANRGINVILLAQENAVTMPNAEGLDFLQSGPKLHHTKQYSSRFEVQEWADHVVRIGYLENLVVGQDGASKGKMVSTDTTRVVYTREARHFFAKSRTLKESVITFNNEQDDAFWQWLAATKEAR